MHRDPVIDVLLDFVGSILEQQSGYWIKIEARLVVISDAIPHGMRYSLTLHDCYGKRILGYDNAHAIKSPKKFKHTGRIRAFDHKHLHASDPGVPYQFINVQQLLSDFWRDVGKILQEVAK